MEAGVLVALVCVLVIFTSFVIFIPAFLAFLAFKKRRRKTKRTEDILLSSLSRGKKAKKSVKSLHLLSAAVRDLYVPTPDILYTSHILKSWDHNEDISESEFFQMVREIKFDRSHFGRKKRVAVTIFQVSKYVMQFHEFFFLICKYI